MTTDRMQAMQTRQDMWHVSRFPNEYDRVEDALLSEDYQVPLILRVPGRTAHALASGALNCPGQIVNWEVAYAAAHGLRAAPPSGAKVVTQFRKSATSIRNNLMKHYGLDVIRVPMGIRATCSEDDRIKNSIQVRKHRVITSCKGFAEALKLADPAHMSKPIRQGLYAEAQDIIQRVQSIKGLQEPEKEALKVPKPPGPALKK
jgi:hypothetical protein